MNKEIIKLTEEIGKVYVEISKLKAKKEVLDAKIWDAKGRAMKETFKDSKKVSKRSKKRK